jgi:hypothetical protein
MPHLVRAHPHIADARMKGRALAQEHERPFVIVLELRRGVDVAQKQADDIGIVGKFQRVGFGCGDAVADSIRVAACVKLLKAAKSGRAVLVTGGQRHRVPPKIDRRANTDAGGDNLPPTATL